MSLTLSIKNRLLLSLSIFHKLVMFMLNRNEQASETRNNEENHNNIFLFLKHKTFFLLSCLRQNFICEGKQFYEKTKSERSEAHTQKTIFFANAFLLNNSAKAVDYLCHGIFLSSFSLSFFLCFVFFCFFSRKEIFFG